MRMVVASSSSSRCRRSTREERVASYNSFSTGQNMLGSAIDGLLGQELSLSSGTNASTDTSEGGVRSMLSGKILLLLEIESALLGRKSLGLK